MSDEQNNFRFSPDFADALAYTAHLHADHLRKQSQIPYVSHLLGVASLVIEHGGTEEEAIAALLHDSIEDQASQMGGAEVLRERIERRFGRRVVELIDGCTDTEVSPKPRWRERKENFIASVESASESVCLIVAADKLHNARSIQNDRRRMGPDVWEIFRKPKEKTLWYYRSLADILKKRLSGRGRFLAEELERVVADLEESDPSAEADD